MREILFRGQTRRYGEKVRMGDGEKLLGKWVYGGIFPGTGDFSVIYGAETEEFTGTDIEKHTVYSDTVGQYTGLKDKNGKKIFEGDIFRYGFGEVYGVAVVKFGEFSFGSHFDMNQVGFYVEWAPPSLYYRSDIGFWVKTRELEVVGNIHDNPDLLEVD